MDYAVTKENGIIGRRFLLVEQHLTDLSRGQAVP